ncbi:hypothetical protein CDAR_6771 [Caerostris darwini]|uniref:Uncharacterized protein n=1 Tax=Caerostris darwini TaxID=1538125 RepID=A0AAV4TFC9_9ARAC|nr:hypothetical protein CDAR_6771 [Caerostris darwini]
MDWNMRENHVLIYFCATTCNLSTKESLFLQKSVKKTTGIESLYYLKQMRYSCCKNLPGRQCSPYSILIHKLAKDYIKIYSQFEDERRAITILLTLKKCYIYFMKPKIERPLGLSVDKETENIKSELQTLV